jgi:prephenate dehydrogenase
VSDLTSAKTTVGIVGLGLIGGSVGLALRSPERRVVGFDVVKHVEQIALQRSCVDEVVGFEETCASDVVFVAVPPGINREVIEAILRVYGPETVVTDCSSVKADVGGLAADGRFSRFVPGHPMAGHEKTGPEFASAWLFRGARWLLTPTKVTSPKATAQIQELVRAMGAKPVRLNAAAHDRHVALLSHLPHILAAELVKAAADLERVEVGGGSWRDLTRVAGIDPGLWTQILCGNGVEVAKVLEGFEGSLRAVRKLLEDGDRAGIEALLRTSSAEKARQDRVLRSEEKPVSVVRRRVGRRPR